MDEAEAKLNDAEISDGPHRAGSSRRHAGAQSDYDRDRFAYAAAKAALAKAKADLNRIKVDLGGGHRVVGRGRRAGAERCSRAPRSRSTA